MTNNKHSLTYNPTNIEPAAVVFNVVAGNVNDFIVEVLTAAGVDVHAFILYVEKDGAVKDLSANLFVNISGGDIIGGPDLKVESMVADKITTSGLRLSKKLETAISGLVSSNMRVQAQTTKDKNIALVRLDPIAVLAAYVGARPSEHDISVTDVRRSNRDEQSIIQVTKTRRQHRQRRNNNTNAMNLIRR